jgi:hypothetical protein
MINKEWVFTKPKDEIFKCFLKTTFANSSTKLTDLEINILDQVKKNRLGFDSKAISQVLDISIQSLNNYKSKLVKKRLLVKAVDQKYYVNPTFNISNVDDSMVITLKFKFED